MDDLNLAIFCQIGKHCCGVSHEHLLKTLTFEDKCKPSHTMRTNTDFHVILSSILPLGKPPNPTGTSHV
jgi:hypothetical protein